MSPKEKAIDLVNKMLFCYQGHIDEYTAKQCALIAVDEILNVTAGLNGWINGFQSYWEEVKQEIEKL
jgi:hypothetical protein